MYGIDANLAHPPFSALISFFLVVAFDYIGLCIVKNFLKTDIKVIKWLRWQAPIIGAALISVIIYPMALTGFAGRSELRAMAFFLITLSFVHAFKFFKKINQTLIGNFSGKGFKITTENCFSALIFSFIAGYALLALAPVTSADSLDYHMGVPIHILNTGFIHTTPEWFHSRLSGSGEALNALALSVGAEQFGSLLQFMGLIAVVGLIYRTERNNNDLLQNEVIPISLLILFILSSPVMIFLIGTSKFQLLPVSMTTLALSLIVFPSRRKLTSVQAIKGFSLICILVMVASQIKINYFLSGGILGLIALLIMFKKKLIWQSIGVGVAASLIILLPVAAIKSDIYQSTYFAALLTPFPGNLPGIDIFESSIRQGRDSEIFFPFSLIIPSGMGTITTILGIGLTSIIFLRPFSDKWLTLIFIISIVVFSCTAILGPKNSRSYLEPYFWIMITISLQNKNVMYSYFKKFINPLALIQSVLILFICWYGAFSLFPGSISASWREDIMNRTANGYSLMKWVDNSLPKDSVLLTTHRSMALVPRKTVSLEWLNYTKLGSYDVSYYLNRIKEQSVTHLLISGEVANQASEFKLFSDCLGTEIIGPGYGFTATRNPFNRGPAYRAWLVDFNTKKLPSCFTKKLK